MAQQVKIIVEKQPDGYIAYPVGMKGVVVGEGDTYEEAIADVKSAIQSHVETFGKDVLQGEISVLEDVVAEWRGQVFHIGEQVVIDDEMAGTFDPEETGHSKKIIAAYGQRGSVIGGAKRPNDPPEAPIVVLKVKWERQRWIESESKRAVVLDEFVATIHASYLAHVDKPK